MGSFEEVRVWCSNQCTCTHTDTQTCDLLSPMRAPPTGVHLSAPTCLIHPLHAAPLCISTIPIWLSSRAHSSLDFMYADFEHFLTVDLEALIIRLSEGESGWFLAQPLSTEPVCTFRVNTSRTGYTQKYLNENSSHGSSVCYTLSFGPPGPLVIKLSFSHATTPLIATSQTTHRIEIQMDDAF